MHVEPITCLRPQREYAQEFCALPYDVFTYESARAYIESHPRTFLAIDRPDATFEADDIPQGEALYQRAQKILRDRQLDKTLTIDETPCVYLYEQTHGDHKQLGVMAAVSVDDYIDGTIRQHERTLINKEQDRVNHIKGIRAQTGPVFLAYPDSLAVDMIISAAKMADPLYDFVSEDGVRQRVWRIARPSAIEAICLAFSSIDAAYIADGHHRAAAAVAIAKERRAEGRVNDPAEAFLAVLFPESQLQILAYDRVVADTYGLRTAELIEAVRAAGFVVEGPLDDIEIASRHTFGMFVGGSWYRLTLEGDPDALDVALLQDKVLAPVLGIEDPRSDARIDFVGGVTPAELAAVTPQAGVSFALFPTSMEELVSISDAGGIMPPKSTWFDPKLLSGFALRRIW